MNPMGCQKSTASSGCVSRADRKYSRDLLIPLNLDNYLFDWSSGRAAQIRERLAADLTNWE